MTEPTYMIGAFMRCSCSRLHTTTFVGPLTVCACGLRLWPLVHEIAYGFCRR